MHEYLPGDWICPNVQVRHHYFVFVLSGLTGRIVATLEGQAGAGAMALSSAGRLASGNLNFMTGRPAIGRYQALAHTKLLVIDHRVTHETLWHESVDYLKIVFAQNELINLTDRIGFAMIGLLPAMDRLKALLLTWSLYYGTLSEENGKLMTTIPLPGRNTHVAQVIRTSTVTLDGLFAELKSEAGYRRSGDFMTFAVDALQGVHDWMRYADGEGAHLPRPKWVQDLLTSAQDEPFYAVDGSDAV
ncbi:Crp/Fnr family transcriptional regulator [Sutterella sp.]|uniref:Crp/Fnr family transcriptional regulator n=1 Tax=Sutterella sp. TaxID=1981025 RepID=UPI0026E03903|nr:Crp/Fnr family transcriptional regulator [Sutterella sp.]MDO5532313.1 Crp/Fnr family transcriptional regulator [Sutterella sp.]